MPRHQFIKANLLKRLREQPGTADTKLIVEDVGLRLRVGDTEFLYRPDIMIATGPFTDESLNRPYLTEPTVIVEVFSPITEDIDRREKALTYQSLDSLEEYVLIAQRSPKAIVLRRSRQWMPLELTTLDAIIELESLGMSASLEEIYAGTYLR